MSSRAHAWINRFVGPVQPGVTCAHLSGFLIFEVWRLSVLPFSVNVLVAAIANIEAKASRKPLNRDSPG